MKNNFKSILLVCTLSLVYTYSSAQVSNKISQKTEKFEQLFKYSFDNNIFNGSVLIIENDKTIYKKSFGDNGSKNTGIPVTSNSQFLLASISKQFTAMGIMLLSERGKLDYDDNVTNYLPDFPYDNITIRHLLNQTSGIPEYQPFLNKKFSLFKKNFEKTGEIITNKNVYNLYKKYTPKLEFTPNEKFNYSNTNYVFLALIIEAISEITFANYMEKYVFKPLKMKSTFVYNEDNKSKFTHRAYGYKLAINGRNRKANDNYPFINIVGDGGIYSTIDDLETWIKALNNNILTSKDTLNKAFANSSLLNNKTGTYGFGWFVRNLPFNGNKALTHSGEFVGFSNAIFNDIDSKNSIVILSNNTSGTYRPQLNSASVRILYNIPYELPKINISEIMGKIIADENIEVAIRKYNDLKLNHPTSYDFKESQLNGLGYDLIKLDKLNDAIEIFILNSESFPESSNVYDSLGEAYLLNNRTTEALKNYQKAFSLNPKNENAAKIIEK